MTEAALTSVGLLLAGGISEVVVYLGLLPGDLYVPAILTALALAIMAPMVVIKWRER